jgi:hypothetical protein
MPNTGPAFERYSASVVHRRACQDTRDDLGGYVDPDHPDHANNSSSERRAAIFDADKALDQASIEMDIARTAYLST